MRTITLSLPVLSIAVLSFFPAVCTAADSTSSTEQFSDAGTTERVSVGSNGEQLRMESRYTSLSPDGRYVGFATYEWPTASRCCFIRVHDRLTGTTRVIAPVAWKVSFSADGRYVGYRELTGQIVLHDQWNRTEEIVSVNSSGLPGNIESHGPTVSGTGRYIAFESYSSNFGTGDTNDLRDIFVHDRATGITEWVSVTVNGTVAHGASVTPSISSDGSALAFYSDAYDLVPRDMNRSGDIFVRDLKTRRTERVNVSSNGAEATSESNIGWEAIDAKGRRVVFASAATNLVKADTNQGWDVFVHDRENGETRRVSIDSNGAQQSNQSAAIAAPSISMDGRYVVFASDATNLVPRDRNGVEDAFVHDLLTGVTTRESVGPGRREANARSREVSISEDGKYVGFQSWADNLVDGDTNDEPDIFVRTRHTVAYVGLASVADLDGNGAPELAALRVLADGNVEVTIKDSVTNALVNTLTFPNSDKQVRGLASMPDISGDGSPEVAVLFRRHDGHGIVQLRDAVSGAEFPELHFFGKDWESRVITSFDANRDGVPDIAVLALKDDMSSARVQIRDAANQVVMSSVRLPAAPGDAYVGLTTLPDMNGNGVPEIAALRTLPGDKQEVIIKDSLSGERIKTVKFNVADMQAGGVAAVRHGTAPAVAVLFRKSNGQGKVQIRNAMTGEYVRTLTFVGHEWDASAIASLDTNSDSVMDIGVLAVKDNGSAVGVQVRDSLNHEQLNWVAMPADDR